MRQDAKKKAEKHANLIQLCERKNPVYGVGDIGNKATAERLAKLGFLEG